MPKVLILEDNSQLIETWREAFAQHHLDVLHARTLREAELICEQYFIEIAILDIFVEDEQGYESPDGGLVLLTRLSHQSTPSAALLKIVITALELQPVDIEHITHQLGVDYILQKPIDVSSLLQKISMWLDRHSHSLET